MTCTFITLDYIVDNSQGKSKYVCNIADGMTQNTTMLPLVSQKEKKSYHSEIHYDWIKEFSDMMYSDYGIQDIQFIYD